MSTEKRRSAKETLEAIERAAYLDRVTRDVLVKSDEEIRRELAARGCDLNDLNGRARARQRELVGILDRSQRRWRHAIALAAAAGWLVALVEGAFILRGTPAPVGQSPADASPVVHAAEDASAPTNNLPTLPAP
jgi:hypothetical protein